MAEENPAGSKSTVSDEVPVECDKIVVVPVEWGQLSKDTFLWYLKMMYIRAHCVHVCHVPDFRRHLQPGMSPQEVMNIMIETNTESELLKKLYEDIIAEKRINGKFVRVGGNSRWCAIVEYCKLVGAVLLVLGAEPKPHFDGNHSQEQHNNQNGLQEIRNSHASLQEQQDDWAGIKEQQNGPMGLREQNNPKGLQERKRSHMVQQELKDLKEENSRSSLGEQMNQGPARYKPEQLLRLCDEPNFDSLEERWGARLSADAVLRDAARKIFLSNLVDHGPFVATVTQEVLDNCKACSIVVYRRPERKAYDLCSRSSSVRGSYNAKMLMISLQNNKDGNHPSENALSS